MADERAAQELMQRTRAARAPLPRWLWIASLVVGLVCIGGFAIAMLSTPESPEKPLARTHERPVSHFGFGLVLGGAGGVIVGWAVGRRREPYGRDHSSRNSP